jgi:hypothetical protein
MFFIGAICSDAINRSCSICPRKHYFREIAFSPLTNSFAHATNPTPSAHHPRPNHGTKCHTPCHAMPRPQYCSRGPACRSRGPPDVCPDARMSARMSAGCPPGCILPPLYPSRTRASRPPGSCNAFALRVRRHSQHRGGGGRPAPRC